MPIHWNLDTITIAPDQVTLLYRRAGQYWRSQKEVRLVLDENTLLERTAEWTAGSGKAPTRTACVLLTFDPESSIAARNSSAALYREMCRRLQEATPYESTPLEYLAQDLQKEE